MTPDLEGEQLNHYATEASEQESVIVWTNYANLLPFLMLWSILNSGTSSKKCNFRTVLFYVFRKLNLSEKNSLSD